MRRVTIAKAGGYERLQFETVPTPPPGPGEISVKTDAIGVNYADCIIRMGLYASAKEYVGWPITPGFEFAGKVAAVGAGTSGFSVGDAVFGVTRFGGYSSDVVVPQSQLFAIPTGVTAQEAAAFPTVFLTAWYALEELARPRSGAKVLIHSAAGGVGSALVQLALRRGCEVVAVVGGAAKVGAVYGLAGAHGARLRVIDKGNEDLWPTAALLAPHGYDAIFDANGVETLHASYTHLAKPGRLVIYGFHSMLPRGGGKPNWLRLAAGWLRTPRFNPLAMTNANASVLAFNLSYLFEHQEVLAEGMASLLPMFASGELRFPALTPFPFENVADAHAALEAGRTIGKVVLTV